MAHEGGSRGWKFRFRAEVYEWKGFVLPLRHIRKQPVSFAAHGTRWSNGRRSHSADALGGERETEADSFSASKPLISCHLFCDAFLDLLEQR